MLPIGLRGNRRSTLIAAQQIQRRAYLMEIDPLYCDVIVERWQNFTGNKAQRVTNRSARRQNNRHKTRRNVKKKTSTQRSTRKKTDVRKKERKPITCVKQ